MPSAQIPTMFSWGATGGAPRWNARGWVGSSGPVSNEHLWDALLCELESPDRAIKWFKVHSHANVVGNEQADTLANHGWLANPLYPVVGTPKGKAARAFTTYKPGSDISLSSGALVQDACSPSSMGKSGAQWALFPHTPPPAENTTQLYPLIYTPQKRSDTLSKSSSDNTDTTTTLSGSSLSDLDTQPPLPITLPTRLETVFYPSPNYLASGKPRAHRVPLPTLRYYQMGP